MQRSYSGNAKATTLVGTISASATTLTVADGSGYPTGTGGPFVVTVDLGLAGEEKVLCVSRTGNSLSVDTGGRGWDGTSSGDHGNGASVHHTFSATDAREANAHVNDTTGDPHPQYLTAAEGAALPFVSTAGGSTVTASGAAVKGLVIKGAASQTANLAEFQNSAGTVLVALAQSGAVAAGGAGLGQGFLEVRLDSAGFPAARGLVVRAHVSQVGNLAEFQNSAGAILTGFTATGRLIMPSALVATTATTGAAGITLPAQPQGYLRIFDVDSGVEKRVPYYNA